MAVKPVKVLTDLLTKKQIIKQDLEGNILFRISGTLGNGILSSSLPISASSAYLIDLNTVTTEPFTSISVITNSFNNSYNVDQAFHAVDYAITDIKNIIENEESQADSGYKRIRYKEVGYFNNDGEAQIILPKTQLGAAAFPVYSIDFINVSVMTKDENAWTNDLLSVNIVSGGLDNDEIHILLEAPALNSTNQYRILAVNENPEDYLV